MNILETKIQKGEKKKLDIAIDGKACIPVFAFCGKEGGKTLTITAGMHGCEYVGIRAAQRLIQSLNPNEIRGNVIVIPVLNIDGFYFGEKGVFPQDKKNLNRIFPGNILGTHTQKVAYFLEKNIFPVSDFLLDLHGGDVNESTVSHVYFPFSENKAVLNAEEEALKALSCSFCVKTRSESESSLCGCGAKGGLASLLLECGGLGVWSEDECDNLLKDIYSLMGHLNIFGSPKINEKQVIFDDGIYENSLFNGFWYPFIKAGESVEKGMLLGEIRDLEENVLQKIYSKDKGLILYYTKSLGVCAGSPVVAYGIKENI